MKKNRNVCSSNRFEISQKNGKDGRRNIKVVLHEIFKDNSKWQDNGISWSEEYTAKNIESISGMSICCQFIDDDKSVPLGHGMTDIKDGIPIFEDATMVGVFDRGSIEDIVVNGEQIRACVGYGHIDEMRSPHFVEWLEDNIEDDTIYGSVEIIGKPENDNKIIYKHGFVEKGRIPSDYIYSGYAILSVSPADKKSIVVELNNENKECEDYVMDEKIIQEIKNCIMGAVSEMNSNTDNYAKKISELNADIEAKSAALAAKEKEIDELNAKCKTFEDESAAKDKALTDKDTELNVLTVKNSELLKTEKKSEMNTMLAVYSDVEKGFAKDEISAFEADPLSVEINSITDKIDREIVKQMKTAQKTKEVELNSNQADIYSYVAEPDATKEDTDSIY